MQLGIALIVWLWGTALYLLAYYAALYLCGWQRLYDWLGEAAYNRLIPSGGWRPALECTLAVAGALLLLDRLQAPLARACEQALSARLGARRAVRVVARLALFCGAIYAIDAGVVAGRNAIFAAWNHHESVAAQQQYALELARDPFHNGTGLGGPIDAYDKHTGRTGERLILAGDGSYRRSLWTDAGGGDRKQGTYTRSGPSFVLAAVNSIDSDFLQLPRRLREVEWGARRYMIEDEAEAWRAFCAAVNSGAEPRGEEFRGRTHFGSFLLREGDAAIAAGGLPSLPDEWRGLLLATPLDGRTLEADHDGGTWIERGTEHGVRIDLELYVLGVPVEADWERMYPGPTEDQPLEVVEVEPQRSRVRYRYAADKRAPIPAGLRVTSRDPTVRVAE